MNIRKYSRKREISRFFYVCDIILWECENMNDCLFCKIIKGEIPCFKVYEDESVLAFLDINPDSNGHTLVIPKHHYQDFYDIEKETLSHIMEVTKTIINMLKEKLHLDGFTLIQNNGEVQDVKHFHLHIRPYYQQNLELKELEEVFSLITK